MVNRMDIFCVDDEDKMFVELMDTIMRLEGERALALNEELNYDRSFSVPEDISIKCLKIIKNSFPSEL